MRCHYEKNRKRYTRKHIGISEKTGLAINHRGYRKGMQVKLEYCTTTSHKTAGSGQGEIQESRQAKPVVAGQQIQEGNEIRLIGFWCHTIMTGFFDIQIVTDIPDHLCSC